MNASSTEFPRLRPELRMSLHEAGSSVYCLVEDPIANSFFRIGRAEWAFAQQFDGKTAPQDAFQRTLEAVGNAQFSSQSAQQMLQWLTRNGLFKTNNVPAGVASAQGLGSRLVSQAFFFKIPLLNPDRIFDRIEPYFRWAFTWPALIAWLALIGYAISLVVTEWSSFWSSATTYFAPSNWVYLLVSWLALKVVHESFHGIACKRFGGNVASCGLLFILFSPIAFVDVTSAWRFRSKWQRIVTSAAGMYIEFAIAAVAAIVWAGTSSAEVAFACQSLVVSASVSSVLFNANPLMRFDGYYMLADLLEIENLYTEGKAAARAVMRTLFLGLPTPTRKYRGATRIIVLVYGFLASFWRVLISLSLVLGAAALFHGAGLVMAVAGAFLWFAVPIIQFARYIMNGNLNEKPSTTRALGSMALGAVSFFAILCLPVPGGVSAPAVVTYAPRQDLRAESDGFVKSVHVATGDLVDKNQILIAIENDELALELKMVTAELKQSIVQSRIYHSDRSYSEYQAELENQGALKERLANLRQRSEGLTVRAPNAGKVLTRKLGDMQGRHVKAGDLLVSIANEKDKEIEISIPEFHIESFLSRVGEKPTVILDGKCNRIPLTVLTRVEPGASTRLKNPALAANNGGPIPVQPEASGGDEEHLETTYRLTSPRFYGAIKVPQDVAANLHVGTIGEARFTDKSETIGRKLRRVADRWVGRRFPGT